MKAAGFLPPPKRMTPPLQGIPRYSRVRVSVAADIATAGATLAGVVTAALVAGAGLARAAIGVHGRGDPVLVVAEARVDAIDVLVAAFQVLGPIGLSQRDRSPTDNADLGDVIA